MIREREHDDLGGRPSVTVQTGPGVDPDVMGYVRDRFGTLARYAPRPIAAIHVRMTKPRDTARPGAIEVRATLTVGNRSLRSHEVAANIRTSLDAVYDRLRRQLSELPHGTRGDHVPHRAAHADPGRSEQG